MTTKMRLFTAELRTHAALDALQADEAGGCPQLRIAFSESIIREL